MGAQTQPILYNSVLYYLPTAAPDDEFTEGGLYDEKQNFCQGKHGLRKDDDDDRIICCCWNPRRQKSGEETLLYSLFVIPLSTEKLLDYDKTFTGPLSSTISLICLFIFMLTIPPFFITHIIPTAVMYLPITLLFFILLVIFNYVFCTLPTLKRKKLVRRTDPVGEKNENDDVTDTDHVGEKDKNDGEKDKHEGEIKKMKVVIENRAIKCGKTIFQLKFTDARKLMIYWIFLFLFNIIFNWSVLRYSGHSYFMAIKNDFNSPSHQDRVNLDFLAMLI